MTRNGRRRRRAGHSPGPGMHAEHGPPCRLLAGLVLGAPPASPPPSPSLPLLEDKGGGALPALLLDLGIDLPGFLPALAGHPELGAGLEASGPLPRALPSPPAAPPAPLDAPSAQRPRLAPREYTETFSRQPELQTCRFCAAAVGPARPPCGPHRKRDSHRRAAAVFRSAAVHRAFARAAQKGAEGHLWSLPVLLPRLHQPPGEMDDLLHRAASAGWLRVVPFLAFPAYLLLVAFGPMQHHFALTARQFTCETCAQRFWTKKDWTLHTQTRTCRHCGMIIQCVYSKHKAACSSRSAKAPPVDPDI
jgi:hypothetical protein